MSPEEGRSRNSKPNQSSTYTARMEVIRSTTQRRSHREKRTGFPNFPGKSNGVYEFIQAKHPVRTHLIKPLVSILKVQELSKRRLKPHYREYKKRSEKIEMTSGDIKGFYRQKKKRGVSKPSTDSSSKKSKHFTGGTSVGASCSAHTPALVSRGDDIDLKDEYGEEEELLRQFDMDMKCGPCIGVDRLDCWERAADMGLHPPPRVRDLLVDTTSMKLRSLWEGCV